MAAADTALAKARQVFSEHGGILRTCKAMRLGINPRTLYTLREAGEIEQVGRGLYRLSTALQPGPGANRDPDSRGRRWPCFGAGIPRFNHPGSTRCQHRSRAGSEGR